MCKNSLDRVCLHADIVKKGLHLKISILCVKCIQIIIV